MKAAPEGRGLRLGLIGALLLVAVGGIADLVQDHSEDVATSHLAFEVAVVAFALTAIGVLGVGWQRERAALRDLHGTLAAHRAERDAWRTRAEKLLRGLGEAIDEQFRGWGLSPAEREVAMLLLKGFGHKEIAALQDRSERTVRQHAIAVYRKSGLSGRAALSAFFLEDLLLPSQQDGDAPPRDVASP